MTEEYEVVMSFASESSVTLSDSQNNVVMSSNNETSVTLDESQNNQVGLNFTLSTTQLVAQTVEDLGNVDTSALDKAGTTTDKYVMVWDASIQKYAFVNPDTVLSAAADAATTQPGLPQDFVDEILDEVEDEIHLDAGTF